MIGVRSLLVSALSVPFALAAQGAGVTDTTVHAVGSPADRRPAIVTRRDLVTLGAFVAGAGLAYSVDSKARAWARSPGTQGNGVADAVAGVGNPFGDPMVVALGAAMWGGGLIAKDRDVATTGFRAVEAIVVASTITKAVKIAAGRARPRVSPNERDVFHGWSGTDNDYESLPSGHATAAFAFASAVSAEVAHRWPRRARLVTITTYALATTTAYARMHVDAHWLSDVTLGAGIGLVSGTVVTRYHRARPDSRIDRWALAPVLGPDARGAMRLGVSASW